MSDRCREVDGVTVPDGSRTVLIRVVNVQFTTPSGGEGTRTLGLYIANVALYQLSYTPGGGQNSPAFEDSPNGKRPGAVMSSPATRAVQRATACGASKSSSQAPG